MSPTPRWITISAVSALGLGIMATAAVGVANAMPLVDSTTTAPVPPISTDPGGTLDDVKGFGATGDVSFPVPASSPDATSPDTTTPSAPTPGVQSPPVQQPPAPAQPVSPNSVSVASPASVDSVD